ncbi:MAG: ATP-binding protein [Planctomycetota bacterium]
MRSIRTYLLSRLLGGAALVLAGAGVVVYLLVARSLAAQFDRHLADRVQGFASIIFQVEDQVEFEFSDELMPEYGAGDRPAYFELRFADGQLLERSVSLGGEDLPVPHAPAGEAVHWTAPLPDGRPGRYVAQLIEVHHVYPEEGPGRPTAARVQVVVAAGVEELLAAEREVLASCVVVGLVLMGLIAFLAWTAVARGLAPAGRLAAAVNALRPDRLPAGLDVGELPAEIDPVARTIDALIRRVDAALRRERRTTADIAHELRTPISELLTVSEVALRNGRDPDGVRKALGTIRDVAARMGRAVSTLLKLARLEMGAEKFAREDVDLGGLVNDLLRSLSAAQRERGIHVVSRVDAGERVHGDPEVLRIVVSNLLSNAVHYSPAGGGVDCRLERGPEGWRFLVENRTDDLRAEDLAALSEPFWRKDGARVDRDRSGLGLALSRALADEAGMKLSFELDHGTFRAALADGVAAGTRVIAP